MLSVHACISRPDDRGAHTSMHNRSSVPTIPCFNHVARHSGRHPLLLTALASLLYACGGGGQDDDGGNNGEGTGEPAPKVPLVPGYVVDCTPEIADDPMVCITKEDWSCSHTSYYVRESICARLYGGTPSDYDGQPELSKFDPDGGGPLMPVSELDCVSLPEGVLSGYEGIFNCDDCRVCGNQLYGYLNIGYAQQYGWDEIKSCPGSYEELSAPGGQCFEGDGEQTPTTSDGDDGGDGGGVEGVWKCTGSGTISGTMVDTDIQTKTEVFMSGQTPDCVNATDAEDALGSCIELCSYKDMSYADEAANSDSKNWWSFPCEDLGNFVPVEANDLNECSGGGPMWMTLPSPFSATATLTIGGATAHSDQMSGLMNFTIGKCPEGGGPCEVSITELQVGPRTVHGVYRDADAGSAPFTVADLELDLLQPVLGEMDRDTGAIRFPDEDLFASISTGITSLDGKPLSEGVEQKLFIVEGAEGTWDGRHLQLKLRWIGAGMSLSLQLNAD